MNKMIIITNLGYYGYQVVVLIDGSCVNDEIIAHMDTIEDRYPRSEYKYIIMN